MTWHAKLTTCALVVLVAGNIAGSISLLVLQGKSRSSKLQPHLSVGDVFPRFLGVDVTNKEWYPEAGACLVIRVTDDRCAYCKKDVLAYESLVQSARAVSCQIVEFAPQSGGIAHDPRPDIAQLKYVTSDVGAVLFPFATPQTIIVDSEWSVRMTKRGMLDEPAIKEASEILESMSSRSFVE